MEKKNFKFKREKRQLGFSKDQKKKKYQGCFFPLSWKDKLETIAKGRGQDSICLSQGSLQQPFLASWALMPFFPHE